MKNKTGWKYTIRKLGFLLVLAALIASPFAVQVYKSATTTDPYILMARAIEGFEKGSVDVVTVEDHFDLVDHLVVVANIPDYDRQWSDRVKENFERHVVALARDNDYGNLFIVIGWGTPVETMLTQLQFLCTNLSVNREDMCVKTDLGGAKTPKQYIKWPGIGNP